MNKTTCEWSLQLPYSEPNFFYFWVPKYDEILFFVNKMKKN